MSCFAHLELPAKMQENVGFSPLHVTIVIFFDHTAEQKGSMPHKHVC
jgi:hypothetical protein